MDELAQCQKAEGLKVVQHDGIWWVEIRPCFFRPILPFTAIAPHSKRYPAKAMLGGFLHAVPTAAAANSSMNVFVYDDLKSYSLDSLNSKHRNVIRKTLRTLVARDLANQEEFLERAYEVYLSFQRRTGYSYKDERVRRDEFAEWAKSLFRRPKVRKMGVYFEGRLCAVETTYLVEDVVVADALFADDLGLSLDATDFLYHTVREYAALTDARYLFMGFPTGVRSLDESKFMRGCKLLSMPAYCRMNPVTHSAVRLLMRSSYRKLLEITGSPAIRPGTGSGAAQQDRRN